MSYTRQESADAAQWMWLNREQATERWLRNSKMIERVHIECLACEPQMKILTAAEIRHSATTGKFASLAELEQRLRELRLWHYKAMLRYSAKINRAGRQLAAAPNKPTIMRVLETAKRQHSLHLGFVQQLNDFFPVGDDVTKDADNATNT